jgi:hypothetical protein
MGAKPMLKPRAKGRFNLHRLSLAELTELVSAAGVTRLPPDSSMQRTGWPSIWKVRTVAGRGGDFIPEPCAFCATAAWRDGSARADQIGWSRRKSATNRRHSCRYAAHTSLAGLSWYAAKHTPPLVIHLRERSHFLSRLDVTPALPTRSTNGPKDSGEPT